MESYSTITATVVGFTLVSLASWQLGRAFTRFKFPLISGYLFTGILAGPFVLGFVPAETIADLRFVDEVSLSFIAFAAGNQMYLKGLRSRFASIRWVTAGLVASTFVLGSGTLLALSGSIPFMRDLDFGQRLAMSLLAGAILVARSPSSAIAIVNEMHAKGPFTKTVLGVTVVMDVAVIVLFAISTSAADALSSAMGFQAKTIALIGLELALASILGYLVGRMVALLLSAGGGLLIKTAFVLAAGYGTYFCCGAVGEWSRQALSFKIFMEPLLVCMVGGFWITNYSHHRLQFSSLIEKVGVPIFVAFFTLTGASLDLGILVQIWPVAIALFAMRIGGIFAGSFAGGLLAGDPMRYNRISWMSYVTQAGIAVGLAKQIAVEFTDWGGALATIVIAVVVLNQLAGPPLFKLALRRVGESHLPHRPGSDTASAVILGIEDQSLALARQLMANDWRVVMADTDPTHVKRLKEEDVDEQLIPNVTAHTLSRLAAGDTRALVAMLENDDANLRACDLAARRFGIPRIVVRLNDISRAGEFVALGAMVVNPGTAMVNLLDQSVRAPRSAAVLLHQDSEHEMVQVTVSDPDTIGVPLRDLRLPKDVLVLNVIRGGHSMVAHGYLILRRDDEVTIMGKPESLKAAVRKFG